MVFSSALLLIDGAGTGEGEPGDRPVLSQAIGTFLDLKGPP